MPRIAFLLSSSEQMRGYRGIQTTQASCPPAAGPGSDWGGSSVSAGGGEGDTQGGQFWTPGLSSGRWPS